MDVHDVHVRIDVGLTEAADAQPPRTGSPVDGIPTPLEDRLWDFTEGKGQGGGCTLVPGKKDPHEIWREKLVRWGSKGVHKTGEEDGVRQLDQS